MDGQYSFVMLIFISTADTSLYFAPGRGSDSGTGRHRFDNHPTRSPVMTPSVPSRLASAKNALGMHHRTGMISVVRSSVRINVPAHIAVPLYADGALYAGLSRRQQRAKRRGGQLYATQPR